MARRMFAIYFWDRPAANSQRQNHSSMMPACQSDSSVTCPHGKRSLGQQHVFPHSNHTIQHHSIVYCRDKRVATSLGDHWVAEASMHPRPAKSRVVPTR